MCSVFHNVYSMDNDVKWQPVLIQIFNKFEFVQFLVLSVLVLYYKLIITIQYPKVTFIYCEEILETQTYLDICTFIIRISPVCACRDLETWPSVAVLNWYSDTN